VPTRPSPLLDTAFVSMGHLCTRVFGVNAFPTSPSRHRGAQSINMWLKLNQSKGSGEQIKSRSAVDSALTSRCTVLHMSEDTLKPSERHQITPSDARSQTALQRTSESSPWAYDCVHTELTSSRTNDPVIVSVAKRCARIDKHTPERPHISVIFWTTMAQMRDSKMN
jgi:hypothetical protein